MRIRIPRHCSRYNVIGIDSGFRNTGVCIVRVDEGDLKVVSTMRLLTEKGKGKVSDDYLARSVILFRQIVRLLSEWKPKYVAAELPHGGGQNAKSLAYMCMSISIIGCACAAMDVPLAAITPGDIKKLVRPKGKVDKREVQEVVEFKLKFSLPKKGDAAEHIADAAGAFLVAHERKLCPQT